MVGDKGHTGGCCSRGRGHPPPGIVPVVQVADLVVLTHVGDHVVDEEERVLDGDGIGWGSSKPEVCVSCSEVPNCPVLALVVSACCAVNEDVGNDVNGDDEEKVPIVSVVHVVDPVVLAGVGDNAEDVEPLHSVGGIGCGDCGSGKPGLSFSCSEVFTGSVDTSDVNVLSAVDRAEGNVGDGDGEEGVPIVLVVHIVDLVVLADVGGNVADDVELLHVTDGIGCDGCDNGSLGIPH